MRKLLILVLTLLVCACGADKEGTPSKEKPESGQIQKPDASTIKKPANAQFESAKPLHSEKSPLPPNREDLERADRILAYVNRVQENFESGFYSLADRLHEKSQNYLRTWRLPARSKPPKILNFAPEQGLFNEAEAASLTAALAGMDKALNAIIGHYVNLEKYVADNNIRDDGKLGIKLARQIDLAHADFIAARRSWLELVRERAAEAENILLNQHPLQRQIIAGNAIFTQFREIAHILASGATQTEMLLACRDNIVNRAAEGAKPPFPARPNIERLYRAFLYKVDSYIAIFNRALNEGFHQPQRRELNQASQACASAWNEFVKEANKG